MEHWEEELVAELTAKKSAGASTVPAGAGRGCDPLRAAFEGFAAKVKGGVERVRRAADVEVLAAPTDTPDRYEWSFEGRTLRLRLDGDAGKFFVSVERDAGLELDELWLLDGALLCAAVGAPRPADLKRLLERHLTLLFRG